MQVYWLFLVHLPSNTVLSIFKVVKWDVSIDGKKWLVEADYQKPTNSLISNYTDFVRP